MEEKINRFKTLLLAENEKHNLLSRKTSREDLEQHIADSLMVMKFYHLGPGRVADIGSGAGFPGLLLALHDPQTSYTLVEADLKKSGFLKMAARELQADNVEVVRERVENLARQKPYREAFSTVLSRAVAATGILLEYGIPLLKVKGKMLLWKGRNYREELNQAHHAMELLQARLEQVFVYNLMGEKDRAILMISKEGKTPEKYPRRVGIPAKRPL